MFPEFSRNPFKRTAAAVIYVSELTKFLIFLLKYPFMTKVTERLLTGYKLAKKEQNSQQRFLFAARLLIKSWTRINGLDVVN